MIDTDRGGRRKFGLFVPDETPEYTAAHDEWTAALGKFVYQFAEVEHHLRRLLMRYCKVTDTVGRALFHSDRVAELKDAINRVLEATGRNSEKAALEQFFSHLTLINGVRNNIVHWGGHQLESGDYIVSNLHLAPIERGRGHRVNAKDMANMAEDLADICAALVIARERAKFPGNLTVVAYSLPASWQYKPRPLPPLRKPRPPSQPPAQERQRASSPKKR